MKKLFTFFFLCMLVFFSQAQVTLWGVANIGGSSGYNKGVIFNVQSNGSSYNQVYQFNFVNGSKYDGYNIYYAQCNLIQAGNGLFYGKNYEGGLYGGVGDGGTIYYINPATNVYGVAYNFPVNTTNWGSLILGTDGKLYGTTYSGGSLGYGNIFSIDTSTAAGGTGTYTYTDLFDFTNTGAGSTIGRIAYGGLFQANNGLMYGMTVTGASGSDGAIYSFNPTTVSDANPPTLVHAFTGGTTDGKSPNYNSTLMQGSDGLLYGMTQLGGAHNYGVVFCCDLSGNNYRIIYSFTSAPGLQPTGNLVQGPNGYLYGMDQAEGLVVSGSYGALFSIDTNRNNPSPYTTLAAFKSTYYNNAANGDVYIASDGNMYGFTNGNGALGSDAIMWEYNLGTSVFSTKYTFNRTTVGSGPSGSPREVRSLSTSVTGPFCQGATISIPFTAIGAYLYDNVFTAQLSDASGNFSSPVSLGTVSGTTSGTITGTLPSGTSGSGYKIRVVASDPNFTGSSSGSITINAAPAITGTTPGSNCGTGTVTLGATASAGTVNWYTASTGGSPVATGNSYTTPSISSTTNYYVDATSGSCITPSRTTITATINPVPAITGATPGSRCGTGTVTLGATASAGTVNWYTASTGGSPVATGNSYTTPAIFSTTNYYVDATSGGCTTASRTTVTGTINSCGSNTWLGLSNAWATNSNWSTGYSPGGCADNVVIPSGTPNDPVIGSAAGVGNITFTQGTGSAVTLTVNGALTICGSISTGSGIRSAAFGGSANVILNGSSAQTLGGSLSFGTLVLDNTSGGVSLSTGASVSVSTSLVLQQGNINTTNGTLTLTSTSLTQNAIIDNFSSNTYTGTITGNITAQRYYSTAARFGQHMIGSPVSGITTGSLGSSTSTGAYITPTTNCDELNSAATSAYGNVFSYHEANGASCPMAEWYVEPSNITPNPGQGYSVVLTHPGTTLSLTGTANLSASYTIPGLTNGGWVAGTLQRPGNSFISGWSLVSNPYLAPLNAAGLISDNSASFDHGILVWDNTSGAYISATTIAPFQAFLVHKTAAGGSATYTINGSNRVTTAATFSRQQNPEVLNLTATNTTTGITDATTVGFNDRASAQFDPAFDFHKLANDLSRHSLYTLKNDLWMMTNYNPSITQTPTIQLGLEPGVSGNYTFNFDGINSFDPTSYITLEDTKLNVVHNAREGNYNFTADAVNDSWTRFVLHFTPPALINATNATCDVPGMISIQQPGPTVWNYSITDANNTILSTGTLNAGSQVMVNAPAGIYTLTLTDNKGYAVVKNIQVNGEQPVTASIAASAKTVEQNQEVTFIGNGDNTATYNWIFGDGVTATGGRVTHSYMSEGAYTAVLNVLNASGCSSQATQNITVTPRSATGMSAVKGNEHINIWSNTDRLYVDFTQLGKVQATIDVYNILGQQIYNDRYTTSTVYTKQIDNIEVGYIIVRVQNNDEIITKKVFILSEK